jgi:hypothetical protein
MGARQRITSDRRLTRDQTINAAVKIIGFSRAQRDGVEKIVDYMNVLSERAKRTRSRESKTQKQFAKQYGAALRKVITMTGNASADFRPLPRMRYTAKKIGINNEVFDHDHFLRHLGLLARICEDWEKSKLSKPKPSADEKQLAAKTALHLLKMHDTEPTTTKTGIFCRLAAVLYGDNSADLQHHCRVALRQKRESGI